MIAKYRMKNKGKLSVKALSLKDAKDKVNELSDLNDYDEKVKYAKEGLMILGGWVKVKVKNKVFGSTIKFINKDTNNVEDDPPDAWLEKRNEIVTGLISKDNEAATKVEEAKQKSLINRRKKVSKELGISVPELMKIAKTAREVWGEDAKENIKKWKGEGKNIKCLLDKHLCWKVEENSDENTEIGLPDYYWWNHYKKESTYRVPDDLLKKFNICSEKSVPNRNKKCGEDRYKKQPFDITIKRKKGEDYYCCPRDDETMWSSRKGGGRNYTDEEKLLAITTAHHNNLKIEAEAAKKAAEEEDDDDDKIIEKGIAFIKKEWKNLSDAEKNKETMANKKKPSELFCEKTEKKLSNSLKTKIEFNSCDFPTISKRLGIMVSYDSITEEQKSEFMKEYINANNDDGKFDKSTKENKKVIERLNKIIGGYYGKYNRKYRKTKRCRKKTKCCPKKTKRCRKKTKRCRKKSKRCRKKTKRCRKKKCKK